MSKPELNKEELISSLDAAHKSRQHFKTVIDKYIQTKQKTLNDENERFELQELEKTAQLRFEQTLDESVFSELEERRMKLGASKQRHAIMLQTMRGVMEKSLRNMQHLEAALAEQGSLIWAGIANDSLEDMENQAVELLLKSLFIRRKVNNGNFCRVQFHESVGIDTVKNHLSTLLDNINVREAMDKAISDLPEVPSLLPMRKSGRDILAHLEKFEGQPWYGSWEDKTSEKLCVEYSK